MIGELNDLLNLWKELLQSLGLEDWLIQIITFIIAAIFLTAIIVYNGYSFIRWLLLLRTKAFLRKDLHPFFTSYEIDKAVRYYIQTKYQDTPPSQGDEPGRKFIDSPQSKLIPMFLKKAFKRDDNRFYMILADAGMGKTTFMINLFLKYKRQWNWGRPKYNIRLLPLGNPRTLDEITHIENQENTILLLDALDEDPEAILDYKERLSQLLDLVWRFREVVITCRTQFFPSREEEPHETGFFKHGTDGGEFYFRKAYVSVFNDWDITRYLLKRYNFLYPHHWRKFFKARQIVKKSPNLMVRPMLLYHIRDLEESKQPFDYSYQIYEVLIEKWLEREANKPGIKQKYGSIDNFKKQLYRLSEQLAINLYENRENRGGLFIHRDEPIPDSEMQLADLEADLKKVSIKESEWRSRSLLNRDVEGKYKFSHKSILEYFLAKHALENPAFSKDLRLSGLDAASNFLLDMLFEKEIWAWKQKETKMSRKELIRSLVYSRGFGHSAWDDLGNFYNKNEEYDKAVECFQKAISIKKDYYVAWDNLGDAYNNIKEYDKAIDCYQKAISIKKDYHHPWNGLGNTYYNKEEYDKAIECYQKAISFKQDDPYIWNNLGEVYYQKEEYDKAIECYQKAISIKKDYYVAWDNLGDTHYEKKEYDKAIECYQKAISFKHNYPYPWPWNGLGNTYYNKEEYDKAIECYQKAISIDKEHGSSWGRLGLLYLKNLDPILAEKTFKKGQKITQHSLISQGLGYIYLLKKENKKAIFYYLQGLSLCTKERQKSKYIKRFERNYEELLLNQKGIPKEEYDAILAQLKAAE